MYRSGLSGRDRTGAIAAAVAINVALGLALLHAGGRIDLAPEQDPLQIFDITTVEPPPPEPPVVQQQLEREQPEEEGAASPENIRSQATPVAAPEPRIEIPRPPPITVSPTPRQGADPTQGAADRPGPGTGAGGIGTGTGAGGAGTGTGGGGTGEGTRPVLITPTLDGRRDYPGEVLRRWPSRGRVFVRFQVGVDGRPFNCNVDRSSGDRVVDQWTCSLVLSKLRFRPATDERGRPTVGWYGYIQAPTNF